MGAGELARRLVVIKSVHARALENERSAQEQRQESTSLRGEQDVEFERALEADRQREAEERAERQRKEEAEDEAKVEAELQAAMALSKSLNKEANLKRKREKLGAEPPKGPDATKLRLQFPNGSKIDRRFNKTCTVQEVRDFIEVYLGDNEITMEQFSISTNFPRKTFSDNSITLLDAVTISSFSFFSAVLIFYYFPPPILLSSMLSCTIHIYLI
jgi:FAS-associated factor 2